MLKLLINYEWTVQAIDPARFGGSFATMQPLSIATGINKHSLDGLKITSSNGNLVINNNNDDLLNLKVYSISGQTLLNTQFSSNFDVPLQKGVYVVKIGARVEKIVIK